MTQTAPMDATKGGTPIPQQPMQVIQALMQVTPFLPPPFSIAATTALSVTNMILELTNDAAPRSESPFVQFEEHMKELFAANALSSWQATFTDDVNMEFDNRTAAMTFRIDELTSFNESLTSYQNDLEGNWLPSVRHAMAEIYVLSLSQAPDNCATFLDALMTGLTWYVTLQKTDIQLKALEASIAYKNKDWNTFNSKAGNYITKVAKLALDVGVYDESFTTWDVSTIQKATLSDDWIPKIQGLIMKLYNARMDKIKSDVVSIRDWDWPAGMGAYTWSDDLATFVRRTGGNGPYLWFDFYDDGWKSLDNRFSQYEPPEKGGSRTVQGTYENASQEAWARERVASDLKAHRYKASLNYLNYVEPWLKHAKAVLTLTSNLESMVPDPAPELSPLATTLEGGAGLPQGSLWAAGMQIQYQCTVQNNKGPSQPSPWSETLDVTDRAFASISRLPAVPPDTSVVIWRRVAPKGGSWGNSQFVDILSASTQTTTYEDRALD